MFLTYNLEPVVLLPGGHTVCVQRVRLQPQNKLLEITESWLSQLAVTV